MSVLGKDLQYAVRTFRQRPAFTAVVILSMAIGIATNATVFSLANALFFKSLALADTDRLVNVYSTLDGQGSFLLSFPEYQTIRSETVFDDAAAHSLTNLVIQTEKTQIETSGEIVSLNYFDALGVRLIRGRGFDQEAQSSGEPIAILSHPLWQRYFDGDDEAIGARLLVNGTTVVVGGIASDGFTGTFHGVRSSLWLPVTLYDAIMPASDTLLSLASQRFDVTARLTNRVSVEAAQEAVNALADRTASRFQRSDGTRGYLVTSANGIRPGLQGPVAAFVTVLLGLVLVVLLVACANIAGLLLVRATERRSEIAIRAALGASRLRLIRQLLTESLLLGTSGGLLGLLGVTVVSHILTVIQPDVGVPIYLNLTPDWRVAGFTLLLTVGTSLLFGITPALYGTKVGVASSLRNLGGTSSRSRLRRVLVIAQLSASLALLFGAGLLVSSIQKARQGHPGFETAHIHVGTLNVNTLRYTPSDADALFRRALRSVRTIPGVQSAAFARYVPLASQSDRRTVFLPDEFPSTAESVYYNVVSQEYFATMGIPILQGRDFSSEDHLSGPKSVIVNQTLADRLGPNALGYLLRMNASADTTEVWTVVGVVGDISYRTVNEPARPYVYLAAAQHPMGVVTIHLRTATGVPSPTSSMRAALRALEPRLPVTDIGPIRDVMRYVPVSLQIVSTTLIVLGLAAIGMTVIGLYALVAFLVAQRKQEIGIRVALGAQTRTIFHLIVLSSAKLLVAGAIGGTVSAWAIGRVLSRFLVGVAPFEAGVYGIVMSLLVFVFGVATLIPTRRVTRHNPIAVLRVE